MAGITRAETAAVADRVGSVSSQVACDAACPVVVVIFPP